MEIEHNDSQNKRGKYITKDEKPVHRLYFTEEYVSGNEVCNIMNNHIANLSNLKSEFITKFGNCPIIYKYGHTLPPLIKSVSCSDKVTSLKDKMVLSYFQHEYDLCVSEILEHVADRIEEIGGKRFLVYKQSFLNKIKTSTSKYDNMMYILNKQEYNSLKNENIFKHVIEVKSNKFITIY